ncbi:MAG: hypothetical protein DCC58_21020, partial [Chloroflexi bacterium]
MYGSDEPLLVQERIPQLRLSLPTYGVSERTLELLKALATLSRSPGTYYSGSLHADSPLAWAATDDELRFHLDALRESGFIDFETIDLDANYRARLTAKGWDHVEKGPATVLPRAFVAMSFSETMLPTWIEGLRPGIEDAGYSAHRVDSDVHVHRIDQKIVADIRTSRFVVVDVTEQKQGAYFEAGLALELVVAGPQREPHRRSHRGAHPPPAEQTRTRQTLQVQLTRRDGQHLRRRLRVIVRD